MVEERDGAEAPRSPSVELEEEEESLVYSAPCGRAYRGDLGNEETLPHLYRPAERQENILVKQTKVATPREETKAKSSQHATSSGERHLLQT